MTKQYQQFDRVYDDQTYCDNLQKVADDHVQNGHYLINIFVEHVKHGFESGKYSDFESALVNIAGGLTRTFAQGLYKNNEGFVLAENTVTYTVVADTRRIEDIRKLVNDLRITLNQECVLMARQLVNKELI